MKLKAGFKINNFAGENIVIATDNLKDTFKDTVLLNETATFIFNILLHDTTIDDITNKIVAEYEVDPKIARDDVIKVIELFKEHNMIED